MRERDFLRERYRGILSYTGMVVIVGGLIILSPLILLLVYPSELESAWGFLLPGLALILMGWLLWFFFKPEEALALTMQEGTVIVVSSWLLVMVFGAAPFMLVGGLDFTQSVFESTSGWSTTGLSVVDVTQASPLILFFRSVMQLAGGAGLAIIMLSALAGPVGAGLPSAEGRAEQLVPQVRRSVKLVVTIYAAYVLVGWLALILAGMSWFDALNHSFTALSTGGFSTRVESIGYWDSALVEGVVIVLMFAGHLNFLTAYTLFQGNVTAVLRNGELRLSAFLISVSVIILLFGVAITLYATLEQAIRVAVFQAVSGLTTTGFSSVGYGNWNSLGWLVLIVLMLLGGQTGSTAGGLKLYRVYCLYQGLLREMRQMLLPGSAVVVSSMWYGDREQFLEDVQFRKAGLFVFLYGLVFVLGVGVLTAYGYSLPDSLFEFASTLGTVGLSVGVTVADAPPGVLWAQTLGMFLGRLEFFAILIGLAKFVTDLPAMVMSIR